MGNRRRVARCSPIGRAKAGNRGSPGPWCSSIDVVSSAMAALTVLVALLSAAPPAPIPMDQSAIFPPSTQSPEGIGGSAIFNALAVYCQAGAMNACSDLSIGAPFDSQYEAYGRTCAGRQPGDAFESCGDLLINTLASTEYRPTTTVLQPGTYFQEEVQPGIYVSGPITGEFCSWTARDEWGYTTNQAFVSSEGLSQTVTAMMILPIDRTVEIDSDCGPMTLVEAWTR